MGIWETLYDQETVTANWLREEKRESEEYRRRLLKEQNDR